MSASGSIPPSGVIDGPSIMPSNDGPRIKNVTSLSPLRPCVGCDICFNNIASPSPQNGTNEARISANCGHIFHHGCIAKWMERSSNCPICRGLITSRSMLRLGYYTAEEGRPFDHTKRLYIVEMNIKRLNKKKRLHDLTLRVQEQASNLVMIRSRITRENRIADQVSKGIIHPSTISGIAKVLSRDISNFRRQVLSQERTAADNRRRANRTSSFRDAILQENVIRLDSDDDVSEPETPPRHL